MTRVFKSNLLIYSLFLFCLGLNSQSYAFDVYPVCNCNIPVNQNSCSCHGGKDYTFILPPGWMATIKPECTGQNSDKQPLIVKSYKQWSGNPLIGCVGYTCTNFSIKDKITVFVNELICIPKGFKVM